MSLSIRKIFQTLAKHVISVHMNAGKESEDEQQGEFSLEIVKKYIHYCRTRFGPRLSAEAGETLKKRYVLMRTGSHQHEKEVEHKSAIPITVRQLEAVIRMSEALAKMQLQPFATQSHVDEALRLFQVSTLDAAMSGNLVGELSECSADLERFLFGFLFKGRKALLQKKSMKRWCELRSS